MSGCEAEMVINLLWGAVTITVTGTAALYLTAMFGVAVPVGVIAFIYFFRRQFYQLVQKGFDVLESILEYYRRPAICQA